MKDKRFPLDYLVLPFACLACVLALWWLLSSTVAKSLPSPLETWEESKLYILQPFAYRGELDQGILRFTWYSLILVAKGYGLAMLIGIPLGFAIGTSPVFSRAVDPLIQILRPVSPLAWLPVGLVLFARSEPAALFTIALCSMWPTVLNTALGVKSVPQDYLNVAKVLKLSPTQTLLKITLPSATPFIFTGLRLSLGIAWLVIVAVEMLTGAPGIGGFLWDGYNSGTYSSFILSIAVIGIVGYILDRMMSAVGNNLHRVIG